MATFSAVINCESGNYGPFDTDRTVLYNKVITSDKSYNPLTGVFSAPTTGLYYFTFCYGATGSYKAKLTLMKNKEQIISTFGHESDSKAANNGGNAVFQELTQGDQVSVLMSAGSTVSALDGLTSFSGHQLG